MPFYILHSYLFLPHFQTMLFHILHSYSFLPTPKTCSSTFYIPIHFSCTHHSQIMPFPILHSYSFLPNSQFLKYARPHSTLLIISHPLPNHARLHSTFLFISPLPFPIYSSHILHSYLFLPTPNLCPFTFYIPFHFSPTPHSQTMPFNVLNSN